MSGPGTPRRVLSGRNFTAAPGTGPPSTISSSSSSVSSVSSARSVVNALNVPASLAFDDLIRHIDHYNLYSTENDFLDFVVNQEKFIEKLLAAEKETKSFKKLKSELESEIKIRDKKMADFRSQFAVKLESISKLESENEKIGNRMKSAQFLIKSYLNSSSTGSDSKEKLSSVLAVLEGTQYKPTNHGNANVRRSPGNGLDTISEAETTDLSMTQSEDDLDLSVSRRTRSKGAKRPSFDALEQLDGRQGKKIRKSGGGLSNQTEHLIARTVVSIPKSGPVHAVSTLETFQGRSQEISTSNLHIQPTAPPMGQSSETSGTETETDAWQGAKPHDRRYNTRSSLTRPQEYANILESPGRFGRTLSSTSTALNPHHFVSKTVIKPQICEPCGKRMKFSSVRLVCQDCRASCHPDCKDKVPLPCVIPSTPGGSKLVGGIIADFAPNTHPMVPALIQHCVNEVEVRGLGTTGLYRVPGSEKEVKELKERFLRGKGVPNLAKFDIHAICGCIKDFLRSLNEPLVGRWFWRDFALATQINDPIKRQAEITRTVEELPPPNQDTLAFIIIHLQRVADITEIKMGIGNLAKVFGPTIVGYSSSDLNQADMLRETKTQQIILETLLSISSEFWKRFLVRQDTANTRVGTLRSSVKGTGSTPKTNQNYGSNVTTGKKIYFTDDSPKNIQQTKQKKKYFDS